MNRALFGQPSGAFAPVSPRSQSGSRRRAEAALWRAAKAEGLPHSKTLARARVWLFLLTLLLAAGTARAGRIQTLDQRPLQGLLQATNGALTVLSTNTVLEIVPLTNVLAAWFEDRDPGATSALAGSGLGLLGYYFPSTNAAGTPFVRLDETIDFDWDNEPVPGWPRDLFRVTWTGEVEPPVSGPFTFFAASDDGVSLSLNNQVVLETLGRRDLAETAGGPVILEAGQRYPIRMIYLDFGGPARPRLLWSGPGIPKSVVPRQRLHPTGLDSAHSAQVNSSRGLLATYYASAEPSGILAPPPFCVTRVDPDINFDWADRDPAPGVARTNFSVRWTGRIQIDHTEEYTFSTMTDERVRFWIDGRLLIDRLEQGWLSESKETVPLVAGEQYAVRFETKSTGGGAVARLLWSSGSTPRTNVPASHLFPSHPTAQGQAWARDRTPPGILLRNGTFVAGNVAQASATSLRMAGRLQNRSLSLVNVARILCQPLSPALAARLTLGRTGVLLAKGDFVDGDFRNLENGRVSLSSVLFGVRSFDAAKEVVVVALRDPYPSNAIFELRLRDQSVFLPQTLQLDPAGLNLEDTILGTLRLRLDELSELRRRKGS